VSFACHSSSRFFESLCDSSSTSVSYTHLDVYKRQAHTLANRILEQEHIAYSEAIARVLSGNYQIISRRYLPKTSDQ